MTRRLRPVYGRGPMTGEHPLTPGTERAVISGAIAVGYINADSMSDNRVELACRGLHAWTGSLGIELATVLVEYDATARPVLRELHDEIRAHTARYVVVPDLVHLSAHPLLQGELVNSIQNRAGVTVLPVDTYTTAGRVEI